MNKVIMNGNLTKDLELRYTPSGTAVAQGTLAVKRKFAKEGEQQADFINFVVWNKQAEVMAQYIKKGNPVLVEGRIQTRKYEDNKGETRFVTEVVVESFDFISGGQKQEVKQDKNDLHEAITKQFGDSVEVEFAEDELPF